jgi:hypothetical protein
MVNCLVENWNSAAPSSASTSNLTGFLTKILLTACGHILFATKDNSICRLQTCVHNPKAFLVLRVPPAVLVFVPLCHAYWLCDRML